MLTKRLLPVVVLEDPAQAVPLAEALLAAGLDVIEITLRTEAAFDGMRCIRKALPHMKLGAGTVLDAVTIPQLVDLGVAFAVSPGINPAVAEAAADAELPLFAGIANPTDIETARGLGLSTLKFFPAEPLGGARMLAALIGPYGHTGIRFIPTGGINAENAPQYARMPEVAAVGGSWFVSPKLIAAGRWDEIERGTREALAIMTPERAS